MFHLSVGVLLNLGMVVEVLTELYPFVELLLLSHLQCDHTRYLAVLALIVPLIHLYPVVWCLDAHIHDER
jgi:hypothetical protein